MDDLVRVLMLDDQFLSRRGLEIVLGASDGIEVVGSLDADAGENLVIDLRPDVVLVGSNTVPGHSHRTCSRVRAALPTARILMMSRTIDTAQACADVDGFLDRGSSVDHVAEQIRRVAHS